MKRILLLIAILLGCSQLANAQVAVQLSPIPRIQFFNASGAPLAGGFLYSYISGTSTPAPTYTDSSGLIQNSNPIVLDAGGFATVWLASQNYTLTLTDSNNVQQWSVNGINPFEITLLPNTWTQPQTFSQIYWTNGGSFTGQLTQANSANRAYFFPDNSGTIAELNFAQTWTAAQTFQNLLWNNGGTFTGQFTQSNTANRSYQFPDDNVAICSSSITFPCNLTNPVINGIAVTLPVLTCSSCGATEQYLYQNTTPVTANTSTTSQQNLMTTSLANTPMNFTGAILHLHGEGDMTVNTNPTTVKFYVEIGAGNWIQFPGTFSKTLTTTTPWIIDARCTTTTAGVSGVLKCYGTAWLGLDATELTTTSIANLAPGTINTTAPLSFGFGVGFGAASTSNSATQATGWISYVP